MGATVLIEPFAGGHRLQAVASVAQVAAGLGDVVVLTSHGVDQEPAYAEFLHAVPHRLEMVFDGPFPSTAEVARRLRDLCDRVDVERAVVMDADQALKRWWVDAPRFLGWRRRPEVIFMLTRYPARLRWNDWVGWRLRIPKAVLALAARATGSLRRVVGFAGRDDLSRGWVVKRVRDPAICSAHSRDRQALRRSLQLPPARTIVGIFGGVSERKHPQLVWEAMQDAGLPADLLLAGGLSDGIERWVGQHRATALGEVIVRPGFLPNDELDQLIAAADVVALVMTNNGPSGIMGKALAAEVDVVTAGSQVRRREVEATGGGVAADLDATSIGAALRLLTERDVVDEGRERVPLATADEFGRGILGIMPASDDDQRVIT